jgi:hypothetical protein
MPIKINPLLLLICPLLFACNAQRYMYSTPAANVCYFKEKNDSKVAAYYFEGGTGGNTDMQRISNHGFDLQAGYAYSNNWAITAAYSSRTEKDSSFNNLDQSFNKSDVNYKRNSFEIGIGRFSLNKRKTSTGNVYFGLGFGNYSLFDNGTDSIGRYNKTHKTPFVNFFIYPSYNFVDEGFFNASIGARLNFMRYGNSSSTYSLEEKNYWSFDRLDKKLCVFAEPNLNLQLKLPELNWVRLETNINFQLFDIGFPEATRLSQRRGGVSIGLYLDPVKAFGRGKK